jgi:hypothetical protein
MTDIVKVRMLHVRKVHMCSSGSRDFFKKHNLDWQKFLDEGLDSDIIEATGDPMALSVVEVARNGQ